ncbi:ABC transporter substrate-binding protein [Thiothrix lacustris]|uniref:ABC transporter substrate-binding protein n=1 Tax=Thiothrix lacustris TaxID=525917 RepID=UPI0027E4E8CE|nr:spermidine/putrescine ABC transporter substrate-binding protein [Thiothrix lacustris]WMP19402.1 spermidine/putrescine ABC transporter substrate-binding protein [Thiothrix lacustris]
MFLKVLVASLILAIITPVLGADNEAEIEEKVLVYNWSDYMPDGLLDEFTRETGIKVEYSTYDNNEILYARLKLLKGRGYDVLVPSTPLVARMRDEGLLQPLDHNQLPHFKDLDPTLLNKPYDPDNEYSVPYLWGTTGIGFDATKVDASKITKWSDLWSREWRGKLLLTDDMREIFHMALKVNGNSTNTTDPEEIKQAYEKLKKLMPNIKLVSVSPSDDLESGKADIGMMWNGEVVTAQDKNPKAHYQYIYPEEGAGFWVDSFVIPARAPNVENAHKFIDYMLRPDVAARCVKEIGYATASLEAKKLLDASVRNNPIIFPPPEVLSTAEFKQDVGKAQDLYLLYWDKLKVAE